MTVHHHLSIVISSHFTHLASLLWRWTWWWPHLIGNGSIRGPKGVPTCPHHIQSGENF